MPECSSAPQGQFRIRTRFVFSAGSIALLSTSSGGKLCAHLHHRSLQLCDLFEDHPTSAMFASGRELARTSSFRDNLETNSHFFIEECDRMQGLQVFLDIENAYGGLATGTLDSFFEEHGRTSVLAFASLPSNSAMATSAGETLQRRLLNASLTLYVLSNNSN